MLFHTVRVVLVLAVVPGLIASAGAAAQQQSTAPSPRPGEIAPGDPLFAETSAIRELAIKRPVKSVFASRDEIERFAIGKFDEQTSADEVRAAELTLRVLGLVPREFAYRSFFAALMKEQVAGAYDPGAQQLQLPDWVPIGAQSAVLVHELTHALQDQHFDLGQLERWQKGDSDAQLAAHALAEGDAMLTMVSYLTKHPDAAVTLLQSATEMANTPVLNSAPAALRETLGFPYEYGMRFAATLHTSAGWKGVSAAYAELPRSTEQIMHPEKYVARETGRAVPVPAVPAALGRGWTRLHDDVHGEWGYYQILKAFLPAGDTAARAAAGWGGDRYALYAGPGVKDALLIQLSTWDTDADAAEFFDAFAARTDARYSSPGAAAAAADGGRRRMWSTAEGRAVVHVLGQRVFTVEGIPPGIDADALIRSLVLNGAGR